MNRYLTILLFILPFYARAQVDIVAAEYFIDTDPGIGSATSISVTSGAIISESFVVPTSSLPVGFHTLYIRVEDMNNVWSISESRSFYVSASNLTTQANIINIEYYIDSDPGYGAGTSLGAFSSTSVNLNPTIPTSSLSAGFHTIHFRALDSEGIWGDIESRSFYVSQSDWTTQASVVALEYFIDSDPGYGSGTSIPISPGTTVSTSLALPTGSLSSGHHVLSIRALDSDGIWGMLESRTFYLDPYANGLISGIEYFFDTDPGYGNGSTLPVTPPKVSIDSTFSFPTSSLTLGNHEIGMRAVMDNGTYGVTDYYTVNVCDVAIANFVPDVVCIGGTTTFTDATAGVLSGDVYSWDFDGDAVEDSNTQGDQSFTYAVVGTYDATLSIDRAGCVSTTTVQVQVEPIPIADAGIDQTICTTSATMAANVPSANEAGMWSVFSGTATITTPTSETSTITGIGSNTVELVWTLTNTLGSCTDSDTVVLSANLPITAAAQNSTVDIGQTINIDVQSNATINPADILTTTITTNPTSGTATVLSDGTVDYTPNQNAPTSDSFVYRITNQCGNFDENTVIITINNQPPTIDTSGLNVTPNVTEVTFDLTTIISDPNNNLDFTTLSIITQPTSGAVATIDGSGVLTIDYTGITFSGDDQLEIEVCDLVGVCSTQIITIPNVEVGNNPPLRVFNGVSPNGDGYHDFLEIENIEYYPNNTVIILNRWGGEVARYQGYDNQSVIFNDATLPSGTYYYNVVYHYQTPSGIDETEKIAGYFLLKVDN